MSGNQSKFTCTMPIARQQPQTPSAHTRCKAAAVLVVAVATLNLHGVAAAQAPAQAGQQALLLADLYLSTVACRTAPDAGCLCSRGPGSRETSYADLQAEIVARPSHAEPPDARQRHTEWRRQCGITSEEDTWP